MGRGCCLAVPRSAGEGPVHLLILPRDATDRDATLPAGGQVAEPLSSYSRQICPCCSSSLAHGPAARGSRVRAALM